MRIVFFVHSIVSDWNHGNAHFLRGVASELVALGHDVRIFEPQDGWSRQNLLSDHGSAPLAAFHAAYPALSARHYRLQELDLRAALHGADIVLVHEWNDPELVRRIGEHRRTCGDYALYFHDTHHRAVSDPASIGRYELSSYDAVLAFGEVLQQVYEHNRWAPRVFCWHEAADTRRFRRCRGIPLDGDLVWIGNFGDEERSQELQEFLVEPVRKLGLKARVYGVRYPDAALAQLAGAGIEYAGYLPNFDVPQVFSRFRVTLHVPRRPYTRMLPGIPTIRPFEALACEIPLISAPWPGADRLFDVGRDFIMVEDGAAMARQLSRVLSETALADSLRENGLRTVRRRHTCALRALELLSLTRAMKRANGAASAPHQEQTTW